MQKNWLRCYGSEYRTWKIDVMEGRVDETNPMIETGNFNIMPVINSLLTWYKKQWIKIINSTMDLKDKILRFEQISDSFETSDGSFILCKARQNLTAKVLFLRLNEYGHLQINGNSQFNVYIDPDRCDNTNTLVELNNYLTDKVDKSCLVIIKDFVIGNKVSDILMDNFNEWNSRQNRFNIG